MVVLFRKSKLSDSHSIELWHRFGRLLCLAGLVASRVSLFAKTNAVSLDFLETALKSKEASSFSSSLHLPLVSQVFYKLQDICKLAKLSRCSSFAANTMVGIQIIY